MSEEEIKEMYEKGIVQIAPMMEHLIEKYKEDKFNLDIQQCQILIHYLLNEREFDENYIDELENEIDKEKEKNGILQKELDKKIEAIDRLMNNPDYICKDKIREKIEKIEKRLSVEYVLYEKAEEKSDTQHSIHRRINMLNFAEDAIKELLED